MRSAPLGFFDSGVGGLTVVRAAQELLPHEDIIYLGDTARVPYGSKSPQTTPQFAAQDVEFLLSHAAKAIVTAHAGTISIVPPRGRSGGVVEVCLPRVSPGRG